MGNVALNFTGKSYRVCDDSWDYKDAVVVCRMLGYNLGGVATIESYFGSENFQILLDDVECNGTEDSLKDCNKIVGIKNHNCNKNKFAGVICIKEVEAIANSAPTVDPETSDGMCGFRPYDKPSKRRSSWYEPHASRPPSQQLHAERKVDPKMKKIVGGKLTLHGKFPWQVGVWLMQSKRPDGSHRKSHFCGATVISEYWVISAAHCFNKKPKTKVRLVVGDHNKDAADRGEEKFHEEEIIMHSRYNEYSYDYDVALLRVEPKNGRGIMYNDYVQPICLPTASTPYIEGTMCYISGWGKANTTKASSVYPTELKEATVPLLARFTCEYLYDRTQQGTYTRRMMCAGYPTGGTDACDGDSGGPLVCKIEGVYTLVGITSWGRGCARPDGPGVYSFVQEYLPWIHSTIQLRSGSQAQRSLPPRPRTG